jgi:hypothetical protein
MAVTMKKAVFWGVAPCGYCVKRRFEGMSVNTISTLRHILEDCFLYRDITFVRVDNPFIAIKQVV